MEGWEELIDPEYLEAQGLDFGFEGAADVDGGFGGVDDEPEFEREGMYGEEGDVYEERKATFAEVQATSHGAVGIGMGAFEAPKGKRRIARTPEDLASDQIGGVLNGGAYDFLNSATRTRVHEKLMSYDRVTVSNIPALVAAGVWKQQNPKRKQPDDKKEFAAYIKKIENSAEAVDVLRYIRSLEKIKI
jgi:hypothetical protein